MTQVLSKFHFNLHQSHWSRDQVIDGEEGSVREEREKKERAVVK